MEEKKYVTEWANENLGLTLKITNMVHEEQTPFQHIEIADTPGIRQAPDSGRRISDLSEG